MDVIGEELKRKEEEEEWCLYCWRKISGWICNLVVQYFFIIHYFPCH
jgi:hypothetical protein